VKDNLSFLKLQDFKGLVRFANRFFKSIKVLNYIFSITNSAPHLTTVSTNSFNQHNPWTEKKKFGSNSQTLKLVNP